MRYLKTYLIDHLLRFTYFIDMFDTLLNITLLLLASLLVCLLILRLSINIKHLYLFFHSLPILRTDILKFRPSRFLLNWQRSPTPRPPPLHCFEPPFIRHLRVQVSVKIPEEQILLVPNVYSVSHLDIPSPNGSMPFLRIHYLEQHS